MSTDRGRAKRKGAPQQKQGWLSSHPFTVIGIILLATIVPFLDKAIQEDDALFVWTGQWIQHHPLDFFGGKTDWLTSAVPMWMANWNPPLLPYVFAIAGSIFGWSEVPLHVVMLGFAFASTAGIYQLAKMWCSRPLLATVTAILTPAFLVSSTTLMVDVPMLSFWVWSLVFFERGIHSKAAWQFAVAGLLAALAIMTKYSAMMMLPLLIAMAVARQRKPGWWLLALAIPAMFIIGYEALTAKMYGHDLIAISRQYAKSGHLDYPGGSVAKAMIALAFAGGSFLPILFLSPWLWRWRVLAAGVAIIVGLTAMFSFWNPGLIHPWAGPAAWDSPIFRFEVAILLTAGAQLIVVALIEPFTRRDSVSIILVLWTIGVFVFAAVINWTINVRGFLPACPAVTILAVRRMDGLKLNIGFRWALAVPLSLAAAVTLSLVIADYQVANSMRSTARQIADKYTGHNIWIEGHQGFQFYLQQYGGTPVDVESTLLKPGDVVAVNWNCGNSISLPPGSVSPIETLAPDTGSWMNLETGNRYGVAGFFESDDGPVPFIVGKWQPTYFIANVCSRVQFRSRPSNEQEVENGAIPSFPKLDWAMDNEATLDTTNAQELNNTAWALATSSDPRLRDPSRAVQLALEAAKITQGREPLMIGTLAAAFAENGEFQKAMATGQIAHDLAQLTGQVGIATRNQELIDMYARGKRP